MADPDLGPGDIEVRLTSKQSALIDGREVRLLIGNKANASAATEGKLNSDRDGLALFPSNATEPDYFYTAVATVDGAQFSSRQFRFRARDAGLRVHLPVYESTSDARKARIVSRALFAIIPQDNRLVMDMLWRIENYSDVAWVPDPADPSTRYVLPDGATELNIRKQARDARFQADSDGALRLAGTFAPGQHDLMLRISLASSGESARTLSLPTPIHLISMRVLLDDPTMELRVDGFGELQKTRNQDGQRRLVTSRDFLAEKARAPDRIEVILTGMPTPAGAKD